MPIHNLDPRMALSDSDDLGLQWFDPCRPPFVLEGFAWHEQEHILRRLPQEPRLAISDGVNSLADCTAGGQVRFCTNSTRLSVKVELAERSAMYHMPATGQSGVDCYIGEPGKMRFAGVARFEHDAVNYIASLFSDLPCDMRTVTLNLPLYMGVKSLAVGLDRQAAVTPPPARASDGRVVVYGTSITQGGCASRPGMAYTNILSRRINLQFINHGYSGNGRGEAEMAHLLAGIRLPACYVLDFVANCSDPDLLRERLPRFIDILRAAHPRVPILVMSRIRYASECIQENAARKAEVLLEIVRDTVTALREQGDRHLHFLDMTNALGRDFDECTVDGGHPTDLGFMRMAAAVEPVLRGLV